MELKVGICGQGFVGGAVRYGLNGIVDVYTYDKYVSEKSTEKSLKDLVEKTDVIFVCVPTPMQKDGSCDLSIVERVVTDINELSNDPTKEVVIKSTVPPGTTAKLNNKCENIRVLFNPEFLTEANANEDFKNQDRIIIGSELTDYLKTYRLYSYCFPTVKIVLTSSTVAETVKYTTNCFLATKVSFANELYQICEKLGISYDKMIDIAKLDSRLGESHWMVPGPMPDPEGNLKPGFSGSCFIKDINAFMCVAKDLGIDPKVMMGAWMKNLEVRPERDWEQLVGRAVSNG